MKSNINIAVLNFKGGCGKTNSAATGASFYPNSLLIEIDKINQSDARIENKDYKSIQLDFINEADGNFLRFEEMLLDDGIKWIDVGAVKLQVFNRAMLVADLYPLIDVLIVPAMDGYDDYIVAMQLLETIKDKISPEKVLFAFNRFNEHEYTSPQEQFSSFFENKDKIKKAFGIDLDNENNYYVLKDSRAVKVARAKKVSLKSLVDTDVDELTARQRACSPENRDVRAELGKQRSLILSAQNFYNDYIINMIQKIQNKLEQ